MRGSILPSTPAEFEMEEDEWEESDLKEMAKRVTANSRTPMWLPKEPDYKTYATDSDTSNKRSFAYKAAMARFFYGVDLESGEKFNPSYLLMDDEGNYIDRAFTESEPYYIIRKNQYSYLTLRYVNLHPGATQTDIHTHAYYSSGFRTKISTNRHSYFALQPANRLYASGLLTFTSKFYGMYRKKDHVLPAIPRFIRRYTITDKGKGVLKILEKGDKKAVIIT